MLFRSIDIITKGGKEAFVKQMVPNLFSQSYRREHVDMVREQVDTGLKLDAASMVAYYGAMAARKDRSDVLKTDRFPIQWIAGKQDNLVPFNSILSQTYQSSVNFVSLYNNCGHMSMIENPLELIRDISEFSVYCYKKIEKL